MGISRKARTYSQVRAEFLYRVLQKASTEYPVDSEEFNILVEEMATVRCGM
jgi:hypothetical protein